MDILNKIIQFFTRVKNWLIGGFTSKKVNIILNDNHSASKLEQFKELYQEFSSICDNTYELSNSGLELDLSKFKIEPIKLDLLNFEIKSVLEEFTIKEQRPFHDEMLVRKCEEKENFKYYLEKSINPLDIDQLMYQEERSFYRNSFPNPQYDINRSVRSAIFNRDSNTSDSFNQDNELHRLATSTEVSDLSKMEGILKLKKEFFIRKANAFTNVLMMNAPNGIGNTPLHIAILNENLPAIKLLLNYGAGLFFENNKGHIPYQLALKNKLVQGLFDNDPSVNKNVRIQKFNYNIDQLCSKKEIELQIGKVTTYKKRSLSTGGPVKTLSEIAVEKILNSIVKG